MTAPTDDTTGTLTRTEAETSTEIAARPAPAADASPEARAKRAAQVYDTACVAPDDNADEQAWLAVVRAVDASRPAAAIERTLNINALARCARAALRIEVPDVVAWEALPEAERVGWRAVVRCILASTTLASRPGLTEEQARAWETLYLRAAEFVATYPANYSDEEIAMRAALRAVDDARASRGETGPAPDPRATPHAGDPASPFAPGSLAAGSATEDRILDRKRGGK